MDLKLGNVPNGRNRCRRQNYCICGIIIATEHFMVIEDVEDIQDSVLNKLYQ